MTSTIRFPPRPETLHLIFRGFLISEIVLFTISIPIFLIGGALAGAQDEIHSADDLAMPAIALLGCAFLVFLIPLLLASWVGLFMYLAWARWLYLGLVVAGSISSLAISVFSFAYEWGLTSAINNIMGIVTGGLLSMMFFSSVAARFNHPMDV